MAHLKSITMPLASTVMIGFSDFSSASPWLEAQDPFLRSSLQLLSDSRQITSPVSHYPMRWSLFGDDIKGDITDDFAIQLARREIQHSLNSARLNRGNRAFKAIAGNETPMVSSFGQFNRDKWGVYTSYESLENRYAFRLSTGYTENREGEDIRWENSYLSLNAGNGLFTVGALDRWWGQGWQHNLILGSYATASPDISVSYIGDNAWLGLWKIETLVAKLDRSEFDYHSASRLVSKPWFWFEYGLTYQTWFEGRKSSQAQAAIDTRVTLPSIDLTFLNSSALYHSLYAELASTSEKDTLGASLIGWTGSVNIQEFTIRTVFESQQSASDHGNDDWHLKDRLESHYPSTTQGVMKNTYALNHSWSVAMYFQTPFDHSIGIRYQESEAYFQNINSSEMSYRFPALQAGMAHLGLRYDSLEEDEIQQGESTIWAGFEFRF